MKILADQIFATLGLPWDSKLANLTLDEDRMIVETIPEYLARVDLNSRYLGLSPVILFPAGTYEINEFLANCKNGPIYWKQYVFDTTIEDIGLVELLLESAQGIQGMAGGEQGPQGTIGIQGGTGATTQGTQGLQGDFGAQGHMGTFGLQGVQGLRGSQGLVGYGAQGVAGSTQYVQGIQGTIGIQGYIGTLGIQGIQGTRGPQGVQGMQGLQGNDGIQGLRGPQGVQGLAAGNAFVQAINVYNDPNYPISYLTYILQGIQYPVTEIPKPNGLIYGGYVSWVTGLIFNITNSAYYINGVLYTTNNTSLTLSAADPTYSRIDVFAVNALGQVVVIEGVPEANPQKPSIDPEIQIELTQVLIPAGAIEPGGVTTLFIYDENVEWVGSSSGVVVNFASTTSPFHNTLCASVANTLSNGDTITFTKSGDSVDTIDYNNLIFYIKLKAVMANQHSLYVSFLNNSISASNEVLVTLDKDNISSWQNITIPLSDFSFTQSTIDALKFRWSKTGANTNHSGIYLDFIKLEGGISIPVVSGTINITGPDFSASGLVGTNITNATLQAINPTIGQFGSSSTVPKITVDVKGRVLSVQEVTIATLTVSDTPPANPNQGDEWFNTLLGSLFIWIIDNDSGQWVETSVSIQGLIGESIQGSVGSGSQGIQGTQGLRGYVGVDGSQGIQGTQGTGSSGSQGTQGASIQGLQGSLGNPFLSGRTETSTAWTLALTDANLYIECNNASDITVTIPKSSVVDFPLWTTITLNQEGVGFVIVEPVDGDVTLNAYDGLSTYGQYAGLQLIKVGTDTWDVIAGTGEGDIIAQGTIGAQGVQGTLGIQGNTGTEVQGTLGSQGTQGTIGIQGNSGIQGEIGSQGTGFEEAENVVTNVVYGYLYNWYAVTDARNIAPAGWHVPNLTECIILRTSLGGYSLAGGNAKEIGYIYWESPNEGANNLYGLNIRGAGWRSTDLVGEYSLIKYSTFIHINEEPNIYRHFVINYGDTTFNFGNSQAQCGKSIRLIKDDTTDTGTMVGNDGKVYPTVKIGNQVWTACNIAETKYRNGDLISGPTYTNSAWAALTTEAYCVYNNDFTNGTDGYKIILPSIQGTQGTLGSQGVIGTSVQGSIGDSIQGTSGESIQGSLGSQGAQGSLNEGTYPAGSSSELQYRASASTFGAVSGSSVSSTDITLGGTITATNFILSSDKRLKENITPLKDLEWVDDIEFVQYKFKDTDNNRYGVIAQDIEKVNRNLVFTNKKGYLSVSLLDILVAKIARLEQKIKNLEND